MKNIKKKIIIYICIMIISFNLIGVGGYASEDTHTNLSITEVESGKTMSIDSLGLDVKGKVSSSSYIPEQRKVQKKTKSNMGLERIKLRAVIGDDNREETSNNKMFPYSAVAYLEVNDDKGISSGTAFMVNDNIALTAAHCVKGRNNIKIFPGYHKGEAPFGGAVVTSYITDNRYNHNIWNQGIEKINQVDVHDWAILILDRNIGNTTGWLGTSSDMSTITGLISYPGDKKINGLPLQIYSPGKIRGWNSLNKIYFTHDMMGGSSGSPVMGINSNGDYYAFGICSYHDIENKLVEYNYAQRLNNEVIGHLITAINKY